MRSLFFMTAMSQLLLRAADTEDAGGYGYEEDTDAKVSPFSFGLNQGFRLTKFEWIPNGGKDGAEQEALEIIFTKGETTRSYRQFPVVKAFGKNNEEITDPNAKEFKDARMEFGQRIAHIAHAFVSDEVYKAATSKRFASFKDFCNAVKAILPQTTPTIDLDIFMQYQWQLRGDATRTFLDIPSKRKHGAFITKSVAPVGSWKMVKAENPDDNMQDAIKFVDDAGNVHPFKRTGWFAKSNFANQINIGGSNESSSSNSDAGAAMNAGTTTYNDAPPAGAAPSVSSW